MSANDEAGESARPEPTDGGPETEAPREELRRDLARLDRRLEQLRGDGTGTAAELARLEGELLETLAAVARVEPVPSADRGHPVLSEAAAWRASLDQLAAQPRGGRPTTLRWILLHMLDEVARHNGHADILRESLDGAVGY